MKTAIKHVLITTAMLLSFNLLTLKAQTPTTPGVELFCEGTDLNLGAAPIGTEWVVRYSTTSGDATPSTTLVLTGGTTIPASELNNGYYYISTVGDASNPEICESEWAEVPVYVFKSLTVNFIAEDYCIEDAANQEFTADITTGDAYETYAYQWYTFDGTTETAIAGATSAIYTPDPSIPANTTTTYRLKVGYLVDGLAYCSQVGENNVTVLVKPGTPTITIGGAATGGKL